MARKTKPIHEDARALAAELGETVRGQAEAAFDTAADVVEDGLDQAHRYLKRQWRERPVTVAATAVGVGVIIGLLLSRRR